MKILQIENMNFKSGTVHICNINKDALYSYNAVKKFAEEKCMDLFIIKNSIKSSTFDKNLYTIISTIGNEIPDKKSICGIAYATPNYNATAKEISVKIYNAVIQSIENLEKKLK